MSENELKHYGVLGMKWGIRKNPSISEDKQKSLNILKKHISEMSDSEMNIVINRLLKETQLRNLKSPPSSVSKFMKTSGKIVVGAAAFSAMTKVLDAGYNVGANKYLMVFLNKLTKRL